MVQESDLLSFHTLFITNSYNNAITYKKEINKELITYTLFFYG